MSEKLSKPPCPRVAATVVVAAAFLLAMALNVSPAAAQFEDGVGFASVRGSDPDADLGGATVAASYSAITNCDAAQSTRPFYVRWTVNGTSFLFKKDSVSTSTCFSEGATSIDEGAGAGTVNGSTPASLQWRFEESPDDVSITVTPEGADPLIIEGTPQPLNGSPGGVWVFGELPWPSVLATTVTLNGAEEIPFGDPDGTGSALLQLNPTDGRVCWNIQVSNIRLPAIAAHIQAAPAGMTGLIVVTLSPPDSSGMASDCREGVDQGLIEDIIRSPEQFYVNIHTIDFPAGAVRGQLG